MADAGARTRVLLDRSLRGRAFATAFTGAVDDWLAAAFAEALGSERGSGSGVALVATGGHGRGELTPASDLDLMVVHRGPIDLDAVSALWYSVWDEGMKLGNSVRTVDEALALARQDLATATALLSTRVLAGDAALGREMADRARAAWRDAARSRPAQLAASVASRYEAYAEVAFALEPDLKEGRGGLRDVHALWWLEATDPSAVESADLSGLSAHYDTLLAARIELHRSTERAGDVLLLQEQDDVAERLGLDDSDVLMAGLAAAARAITWQADDVWASVRARPTGRFRRRPTIPERVEADAAAMGGAAALAVARDAARQGVRVGRSTLDAMVDAAGIDGVWGDEARADLVALLGAGHDAIEVIEDLDMVGMWCRLLPEWTPNRSHPQRNAYHRFTVDRHLLEATANAAELTAKVGRPDLLLMGALLHDIGKGYPGDHATVGTELARGIAARLGFPPRDVDTIAFMVEHHLLIPDVATRRDLDDPATIRSVADVVHDAERLELLAVLTEADSVATGPSAWSEWKAGLVDQLVGRVRHVLDGGDVADVTDSVITPVDPAAHTFADDDGSAKVTVTGDMCRVVCPDRHGLFSRIAGVLAINGLEIIEASASSDDGVAVDDFRVSSAFGTDIAWSKVEADLDRALRGRLALEPRLAERARSYRRRPRSARSLSLKVEVLNGASDDATVVEVVGPDRVGLLYRLTRTLTELDLEILRAKIVTIGSDAIDTFYVVDRDGGKIDDPQDVAEIRSALLHELTVSAL